MMISSGLWAPFATIIIFVMVSSCTTAEKAMQEKHSKTAHSQPSQKRVPPVDLVKLSKELGMYKDIRDIGFYERTFNDCRLPREHRLTQKCNTQILTAIQFRMRCRDSEGTVENVSHHELEPLVSSSVRWNLSRYSGTTTTDASGFGRVLVRSAKSLRNKRFRLTHNNQMMAVSASEVRQFVLPRYWCN